MPTPILLVCFAICLQLLGLSSVALARISQGSSSERLTQRLFYFFLICVAGLTLSSAGLGLGWWPMCGMTFAIMVVGATLDASASSEVGF